MIVKEYRCAGHGLFDSADTPPICPRGCTAVSQVFITPRGLIGRGTKNIDNTFQTLANDFGLADMNTHGGTTAARVKSKAQVNAEALQEKLRVRFAGAIPKGGTYHAGDKKVIGGGAGQGALAALAAQGAPETDVVSQVKPLIGTTYQNRVIATRDPDKESVAKVKAA